MRADIPDVMVNQILELKRTSLVGAWFGNDPGGGRRRRRGIGEKGPLERKGS